MSLPLWTLPKEIRNSKEKHQLVIRLKDHEESLQRAKNIVKYHEKRIIELNAEIKKLDL